MTNDMVHQRPRDQILYCDNCGISFLWSQEEQQQAERTTPPRYCAGCRVLAPPEGFERGLVKWFNRRRRYGFIIRRDADEIFAHGSDVVGRQSMRPGDLVEFRVEEGDRGLMAKEIRIIDHTDEPIAV